MRRVSPLLFIAAFDYAPYPGTAGLRFSLSRFCPVLACTHGDSPFHPSTTESPEATHRCHSQYGRALCDLSLPASLHWHIVVRFCVRARTLALSHFGIRVSSGGGTFLTTCCRGGCSSSLDYCMVSRGIICCHGGRQRWGLLPHIYNILKHKVRIRVP